MSHLICASTSTMFYGECVVVKGRQRTEKDDSLRRHSREILVILVNYFFRLRWSPKQCSGSLGVPLITLSPLSQQLNARPQEYCASYLGLPFSCSGTFWTDLDVYGVQKDHTSVILMQDKCCPIFLFLYWRIFWNS